MKMTKRLLSTLLVLTLALALLAGCSAPKLVLGGTPDKAGTVEGQPITTGEYLTYLYNVFYNQYYNSGYYQYAQYGMDVWSQSLTYGEGDAAQTVSFGEYLKLTAKDSIARQEALRQMLAEENIAWDEEQVEEFNKNTESLQADALLSLGISNDSYIKVNEQLTLNEQSLFYGRYGKGGTQEIADSELRDYFDKNYVSYKMISIGMTTQDSTTGESEDMSEAEQKEITDQLNGYLTTYNKDKNFEAIVDEYNKANAAEGAEVTASTDEANRKNVDTTGMDEELVNAIRGVNVGEAKVVTYKAGGSTLTAALILRLDINSPETLFTDEAENIIYGIKYEAFDEEVKKRMESVTVELKKSVVKACDPKNFIEDVQ